MPKRLKKDMRQMTPNDKRDIPCHMTKCSETKRGNRSLWNLAIFCSGTGWALVCPWEVEHDCLFIAFVSFLPQFLFCLLNKLHLHPSFLTFLSFLFLSSTVGWKGSEQTSVVLVATRISPQHCGKKNSGILLPATLAVS